MLMVLCGRAQQLHSLRLWGVDEGLPDRNVHSLAEDKNGFMWLGTEKGLIRFDGRNFVPFSLIDTGNPLASAAIYEMRYQAPYLWVGTDAGLFVLNTISYKVTQIFLPIAGNLVNIRSIRVIHKLRNQKLAIGASGGKMWIAASPDNIIQVYFPGGTEEITSINDDERNNIWITTFGNRILCITQPAYRIIYHHRFDQYIQAVYRITPLGHLVKGVNGIYRLDTATNKLLSLNKPFFANIGTVGIVMDSDSSFLAHRNGKELYRYTPGGITSFNYIFDKVGDRNFYIKALIRTRNYIWIGTNYGLLKVSVSLESVPHYFYSPGVFSQDRSVRGMCEDKQHNLYFASYKGLFKIPYPYDPDRIVPLIIDSVSDLIPYAVAADNDALWIGSEGGGLVRYNLLTGDFRRFPEGKIKYKQKFIISLYNDTALNQIVAGSYRGVSCFDKKTNRFKELNLYYGGIQYNQISFFQVDKIGEEYWFCTSKGILKCDKNFVPVKNYTFNNSPVNCMVYDSKRNLLWAGTRGNGLYVISLSDNKQLNYRQKDGLSDNQIVSMVLDRDQIWIATYNGLSRLNIENRSFMNLHTQEGLSHNEFNHGASFTNSEGKIFMGGINGYNLINPLSGVTVEQQHLPFISSLYVLNGNKEMQVFNCKSIPELFIPTNNKVIEFGFGLTDYDQPEKNVYAYRLDGIDPDWVYLGNRNYLRLTELKAGSYKLHVKAAGSNGKWNMMPYAMHITVDEHFYFKWWFILLMVAGVIISVVVYYRIRLNQVKKLYNLRMQISSDLHDEVGSILTAVGMQAELLQHTPPEQSRRQLKQIADTSRQAVSNMRDVVWSIDSRNDNYKDLVDRMNEYLALLFENTPVHYEFVQHSRGRVLSLDLVTRQNTYLIFKEAINNITKHSDASRIKVELFITDKTFTLAIKNNGNPIQDYKAGMGLKNMEMRARKMKADIVILPEEHYNVILKKKFARYTNMYLRIAARFTRKKYL